MRRRPIARAAVRTTAVVGTAAVVGGHMANKQAAQAQEAAAEAPAPAAPEPAAAAPDPIEQLTQLAALKDSGALTEAEFEAQKAKILARQGCAGQTTATLCRPRPASDRARAPAPDPGCRGVPAQGAWGATRSPSRHLSDLPTHALVPSALRASVAVTAGVTSGACGRCLTWARIWTPRARPRAGSRP